jgi:hypothetical protein
MAGTDGSIDGRYIKYWSLGAMRYASAESQKRCPLT